MSLKIINAEPLLLKPLAQQIKEVGGEGYNCPVKVTRLNNSFSVDYCFNTNEGERVIRTSNDFQVGMVDDVENYFVMFNTDNGEYTLITPKAIKKAPFKLLLIKSFGFDYQSMIEGLEALWPNRVVWNLSHPDTAITKTY